MILPLKIYTSHCLSEYVILPLRTCTSSYSISQHARHTASQNTHNITLPLRTNTSSHYSLSEHTHHTPSPQKASCSLSEHSHHTPSQNRHNILPLGTCTFHSLSEHTHDISSQHINISHTLASQHITLPLSIQITSTPKLSTLTSHF